MRMTTVIELTLGRRSLGRPSICFHVSRLRDGVRGQHVLAQGENNDGDAFEVHGAILVVGDPIEASAIVRGLAKDRLYEKLV